MGTNECSQPASKSSWDSQDFGDVRMVLKWSIFASPPGHNELNNSALITITRIIEMVHIECADSMGLRMSSLDCLLDLQAKHWDLMTQYNDKILGSDGGLSPVWCNPLQPTWYIVTGTLNLTVIFHLQAQKVP